MKISHPLLFQLVGFLGAQLIRTLHLTSRVNYFQSELISSFHQQGSGVLYAFWHGKMLVPACTHRRENVRVLISPHRDGEYLTHVLRRLGFSPVRGSTNKRAVNALLELKRESSQDVAFAIDGPRGPRHQINAYGIFALAQHTGWPIIPSGLAISRKWKLRSWDHFEIPKPFAHLYLEPGEPLFVPKEVTDFEPYRELLQSRMEQMNQKVEGYLLLKPSPQQQQPKDPS